jgi:hypothetical protein
VAFADTGHPEVLNEYKALGFKENSSNGEFTIEQKSLLDGVGSAAPRLQSVHTAYYTVVIITANP